MYTFVTFSTCVKDGVASLIVVSSHNGSWLAGSGCYYLVLNRAWRCRQCRPHWLGSAGGVFLASRSSALSQKLVVFFVIFRPRGVGAYGVI